MQFALHRNHIITVTKTNQFMLLGKTNICLLWEPENLSALCGQNAKFQYAKVSGTHSDHCTLKGL
jgi:hypothetical protein